MRREGLATRGCGARESPWLSGLAALVRLRHPLSPRTGEAGRAHDPETPRRLSRRRPRRSRRPLPQRIEARPGRKNLPPQRNARSSLGARGRPVPIDALWLCRAGSRSFEKGAILGGLGHASCVFPDPGKGQGPSGSNPRQAFLRSARRCSKTPSQVDVIAHGTPVSLGTGGGPRWTHVAGSRSSP